MQNDEFYLPARSGTSWAVLAMSVAGFIKRQIGQIKAGSRAALVKKARLALNASLSLPALLLAVPVVLVVRLLRPVLVLRAGALKASRIGHFALNTEVYRCECDAGINTPAGLHADFFYLEEPVSNRQLAKMWRRLLRVLPMRLLAPICRVNRLIPGGAPHEVGRNTQADRDVYNLLDKFAPHLTFSPDEEARGEAGMRAIGIAPNTPFVCLIVRDSAYLQGHLPGQSWDYHDYRDSDIGNYVMAAEELVRRGYYVVRMGAKVRERLPTAGSKIIDYATNGMRTDFMDIYLGAKCAFCISSSTGFDCVPAIFRRPIAYVDVVPVGYMHSYRARDINIVKHHIDVKSGRELRLKEIFGRGAGFSLYGSEYETGGIRLVQNTPEEIKDVVVEMTERLNGTWQPQDDDAALQKRFWDMFPMDAVSNGERLHGEIRSRFGSAFLRNNRWWLE